MLNIRMLNMVMGREYWMSGVNIGLSILDIE